jgi:hypothetical protein
LNDTSNTNFDGVDVFVWFGTTATIDILYYSSMAGGAPSGLIHSQTGFVATEGWNRLLLTTPQSFPIGAERGIVLKIVSSLADRLSGMHLVLSPGAAIMIRMGTIFLQG